MTSAARRSPMRQSRLGRGAALARLALRIGGRYLARSPRLIFASVERRGELRHELALRTADDVAEELGSMKGALMKLGQMASYIDEDMPQTFRSAMGRLQHNAPPMSSELASSVIEDELGAPPERIFARWDPLPFAAASIGQVHRAITLDGRAVAVKVQYPGIAKTIVSDVQNVALLRRIAGAAFPGLDTRSLIDELGERLREEVDYSLEAENQALFATYYAGHPVIHVPHVVGELSSTRVLTSELVVGSGFDEVLRWSQHERNLAGETINRFVSRSLYRLHAFNGDPHPGNYLFHGQGRVTFLDFGLTKHFTAEDLAPLADAVRFLVIENDADGFRASLERAGFLRPGAPVPTQAVVDRFGVFYSTVLHDAPMTMTPAYASGIVRRFFDARGPLAPYSDVPRAYVILQRINLGLYALLGSLNATANWRRIAAEIWPFVNAPPSTPIGEAEARWEQGRHGQELSLDRSA
jgi:predicted unusual protein kinase regulating ubiquinone biosynthesis (AarF/ABC1/UbiB family)